MTVAFMKNQLQSKGIGFTTISKKNDVFTIRKSFFYTGGFNATKYVALFNEKAPEFVVVDSGEKWVPFRGGAKVANQSHWFIKFKLNPNPMVVKSEAYDEVLH